MRPEKVRGYISHAAQTAKLLIKKKETELASVVTRIRMAPAFSLSVDPSQSIAAYQAHVTKWSQLNGYRYTSVVSATSDPARSTSGIHIRLRETRDPKNRSAAPTGVNAMGCGMNRTATANSRKM